MRLVEIAKGVSINPDMVIKVDVQKWVAKPNSTKNFELRAGVFLLGQVSFIFSDYSYSTTVRLIEDENFTVLPKEENENKSN